MAYAPTHGLLYVLAVFERTTTAGLAWNQLWVYAIAGRAELASFSPNPEGGDDAREPEDFRFALEGFTIRRAHYTPATPTRLFLHDYDGNRVNAMAYDSARGLLYLAVGGKLLVVR